jgi:DNA polymerase III sliding clamp (beta) subunit (PCNA family)
MKIQRKEFLRHLESCAPGLSSTENIEQSDCFLFSNGKVYTFNDEVLCQQDTIVNFRCAAPAKPLLETLRKLTEEEIDIEYKDDRLVIKCANVRQIKLNVHPEVIPHYEAVDAAGEWADVPPVFADALAMAADSAAKDSEAWELTCVELSPRGLQATDAFQAIRYKLDCPISKPTLIKRSACGAVNGLGVAALAESEGWLHFKTYTGLQVAVRTYSGSLPDLSDAFRSESEASVRLPSCLLDALQKATAFLADTGTGKQAQFRLKPGKIMVRGQNESGIYEEVRDVQYDGPARAFGINPKYVQTLLKHDYPVSLTQTALRIRGESFVFLTSMETVV